MLKSRHDLQSSEAIFRHQLQANPLCNKYAIKQPFIVNRAAPSLDFILFQGEGSDGLSLTDSSLNISEAGGQPSHADQPRGGEQKNLSITDCRWFLSIWRLNCQADSYKIYQRNMLDPPSNTGQWAPKIGCYLMLNFVRYFSSAAWSLHTHEVGNWRSGLRLRSQCADWVPSNTPPPSVTSLGTVSHCTPRIHLIHMTIAGLLAARSQT